MNITLYTKKKKKTLCNTLDWGNWNSGFVKLGIWCDERDKRIMKMNIFYDWPSCRNFFMTAPDRKNIECIIPATLFSML